MKKTSTQFEQVQPSEKVVEFILCLAHSYRPFSLGGGGTVPICYS